MVKRTLDIPVNVRILQFSALPLLKMFSFTFLPKKPNQTMGKHWYAPPPANLQNDLAQAIVPLTNTIAVQTEHRTRDRKTRITAPANRMPEPTGPGSASRFRSSLGAPFPREL